MRFTLLALVAGLLQGVAAVNHHSKHGRSHHRDGHHAKHHAKKHHHEQHSKHKTASYASMAHSLNKMVERNGLAEAEIEDSTRRLEEALLDAELAANTTAEAANTTAPALRGAQKLPGNLSSTLKVQEVKLSELFNHLKANIGDFNKREAEGKKDSSAYAERLKKRLEQDKKKLEDPKLSDFDHEMLVNRTRTEEHELKFWTRGRELQHDMFHSNLKLTHGLMSRVKTVMDAYKQVMATGKLDTKLTKTLHETSASMPKALIQKQQRVQKDVNKIEKHLKISAKLLHRA